MMNRPSLTNKILLFLSISILTLPINAPGETIDSHEGTANVYLARAGKGQAPSKEGKMSGDDIKLEKVDLNSTYPLIKAINDRRSVRSFTPEELTIKELSTILWACQGITDPIRDFRAAPSAGATYPIELFVVMERGVYEYIVKEHTLRLHKKEDMRKKLQKVALGQSPIGEAAAVLVFCYDPQKIVPRYRDRSVRYSYIEAGHIAQNGLLAAVSLGLGGVPVGAFYDREVKNVLGLKNDVLYLVAIGNPM